MQALFINRRSLFTQSPMIKNVHSAIYHGIAGRNGEWSVGVDRAFFGEGTLVPLEIRRSHRLIPLIAMPLGGVVVSSHVAELLSGTPGVEFRKVHINRLVDFYYAKGDMSYFPDCGGPDYVEPSERLSSLPDEQHLVSTPELLELVMPRNTTASRSCDQPCVEVRVRYGRNAGKNDAGEALLCDHLLKLFPIQVALSGYIMRDDVFRRIEDCFDWDFFVRTELFEVPK
jgi:hypothetical protein